VLHVLVIGLLGNSSDAGSRCILTACERSGIS